MGQPAAWILGLDLSVGPSIGPERAVVVPQVLGDVLGDQPGAVAPAQERGDLRASLVDGVVGRAARGAEAEQVTFGEFLGVPAAGVAEQSGEGVAVVPGGLGVRVPAAELVEVGEQVPYSRAEGPDLSGW